MAPITGLTSKASKQSSASTPVNNDPTFTTLMLALDRLKSDLQHDLQDVKLAISTTNTDLEIKVTSISSTLETL
jgi:hypothetical protein